MYTRTIIGSTTALVKLDAFDVIAIREVEQDGVSFYGVYGRQGSSSMPLSPLFDLEANAVAYLEAYAALMPNVQLLPTISVQ
jgi:hypothetical protein